MKEETIKSLKAIFKKHEKKRICVVGTMACGKTTLCKRLSSFNCIDVDDVFWPLMSQEQIAIFSVKPLTLKLFKDICQLMVEKVEVAPGHPLFGVVILDCEVVVHLDISDELLAEHCRERGDTQIEDALLVKECIEADLVEHQRKDDKVFYHLTVTE